MEVCIAIFVALFMAWMASVYSPDRTEARQKRCLSRLSSQETAFVAWETTHERFGTAAKTAFGWTPLTGRLTGTAPTVPGKDREAGPTAPVLPEGAQGAPRALPNAGDLIVTGAPPSFHNQGSIGPLSTLLRDTRAWICPSALALYYGGVVQSVPDDYLDTTGNGVNAPHAGEPVGLLGRYAFAVAGRIGEPPPQPLYNTGFPAGWITAGTAVTAGPVQLSTPIPQVPFRVALCGAYGTFGGGRFGSNSTEGESFPDSMESPGRVGGPVDPLGNPNFRHTLHW